MRKDDVPEQATREDLAEVAVRLAERAQYLHREFLQIEIAGQLATAYALGRFDRTHPRWDDDRPEPDPRWRDSFLLRELANEVSCEFGEPEARVLEVMLRVVDRVCDERLAAAVARAEDRAHEKAYAQGYEDALAEQRAEVDGAEEA